MRLNDTSKIDPSDSDDASAEINLNVDSSENDEESQTSSRSISYDEETNRPDDDKAALIKWPVSILTARKYPSMIF